MDVHTIRLLLRATARISFLFFLCAFVAPALARLWPGTVTHWPEEKRRGSILAFAASHTIHLGLIITLAVNLGGLAFMRQTGLHAIIGGGTTYLFIYVLAVAAAFPNRVKLFESPRFQAVAYYLIWAIFALAFAGAAVRSLFYLPFALAAVAALVLRLIAARQTRKAPALATASR